ncbi:MAG: ATP synthase subunit I [Betaproteobacteria bacterium]|nr:ATP synthase subunit I [Betaproteobacteria bacterium]
MRLAFQRDLVEGKRKMLADSLATTYWKVLGVQGVLVLLIAGGALIWGPAAATSVLAGGAAVLAGNVVYFSLARESRLKARPAGRVLGRHLFAEAAKLVTITVILLLVLACGWFVPLWVLAAMGVALMGHWLALLIIK